MGDRLLYSRRSFCLLLNRQSNRYAPDSGWIAGICTARLDTKT